jgi:hypothetical protein
MSFYRNSLSTSSTSIYGLLSESSCLLIIKYRFPMNQYHLLPRNVIDKRQAVEFEIAETTDAGPQNSKLQPRALASARLCAAWRAPHPHGASRVVERVRSFHNSEYAYAPIKLVGRTFYIPIAFESSRRATSNTHVFRLRHHYFSILLSR